MDGRERWTKNKKKNQIKNENFSHLNACQMKAFNIAILFFCTFPFQNYERMNLADALQPKSFSKGDRIIKQGMIWLHLSKGFMCSRVSARLTKTHSLVKKPNYFKIAYT